MRMHTEKMPHRMMRTRQASMNVSGRVVCMHKRAAVEAREFAASNKADAARAEKRVGSTDGNTNTATRRQSTLEQHRKKP